MLESFTAHIRAAEAKLDGGQDSAQQQRARILLVDTDLIFTSRICSVLERAGYSVKTASDATAALNAVRGADPPVDLVICNLASPAAGLPLVRAVKAIPDAPKVLAYMSHVKIPAIRAETMEAGVDKLCANSAVHLRLPDLVSAVLAGTGPREEE